MPYFLMIFALLLPLSAALTLPLVFRLTENRFAKHYVPYVLLCSSVCLSAMAVYACNASMPYEISLSFPPAFDFSISAGPLTALLAALISAGCFIAALKMSSVAESAEFREKKRFCMAFLLFSDFLSVAALSSSLLWICVLWLLAAICLWAMAGNSARQEDNMKADQMLARILAGAMLMFCGAISAYLQYGTFSLNVLHGESISLYKALLFLPGLMMPVILLPGLCRFAAAGRPLYNGDYLLPAAMYAFAGICAYSRLFCACFAVPESFCAIAATAAFAVMAVSVWEAAAETDSRRNAALIVSIALCFPFPAFSAGTNMGFSGGLMSLFTSLPLILAIIMLAGIKRKDNLSKTAYSALFICLISLAGLPPAGAFFGRFMIFCGMAQQGSPILFPLFAAMSVALLFMLFRFLKNFRMNDADISYPEKADDAFAGNAAMALGIISVLSGLLVYYPSSYIVLSAAIHGVNLQ